MRRLLFRAVMLLIIPAAAHSQIGHPIAQAKLPAIEMGEARQAYSEAFDRWKSNDPNLEAEFLKLTPEQRKERAARAQRLRDDLMTKKAAYFEATSKYFQSLIDLVSTPETAHVDIQAMKDQTEQIDHDLMNQKAALDAEIKSLPNDTKSTILKSALESEKAALSEASDKLRARMYTLDEINRNSNDAASRKDMESSFRALIDNLNEQKGAVARARDAWDGYYRKMAAAVPVSASGGSARSAPDEGRDTSATQGISRPRIPSGGGPGSYAGSWVVAPSGKKGWPDLIDASLEVTETGGQIAGTLALKYDGEKGITTQTLKFNGPLTPGGSIVKWSAGEALFAGAGAARSSLEGSIELVPEDATMTVSIIQSSNPREVPDRKMFGLNKAK